MLAEKKGQTSMSRLQFTTVAPCLGAGISDLMLLYNRFENLDLFGPFDVFALAEKLSAIQSAYCIFKLFSPFDRTIGYNVEENDVLA